METTTTVDITRHTQRNEGVLTWSRSTNHLQEIRVDDELRTFCPLKSDQTSLCCRYRRWLRYSKLCWKLPRQSANPLKCFFFVNTSFMGRFKNSSLVEKINLRTKAWNWGGGGGRLSFPDKGDIRKSINLKKDIKRAESTEVRISFSLPRTSSMAGNV